MLLHEVDHAFQDALRIACARHCVGLQNSHCSLRGTLTPTADGFDYSGVTIHVCLRVAPADMARAAELLGAASREVFAERHPGVAITVSSSVLPAAC